VRTHFEHNIRAKSRRLADLKNKTTQLERKLSDARMSLERELAQFAPGAETAPESDQEARWHIPEDTSPERDSEGTPAFYAAPQIPHDYDSPNSGGRLRSPEERTEVLVSHGRRSAYSPGRGRWRKAAIAAAAVAVFLAILVIMQVSGGPSWPSSVSRVQSQVARACQNPDVKSEPGQVNFACAKSTRQVLWVFALLMSRNNANFTDPKTGRQGLEPITPAQGGEVAWSLNLHHPYDPSNPIDSLEVAARAINNIIGGATVTGTDGGLVVQPGLESKPGNCVRYTGSAALTSRVGFPALCAKPLSSPRGQSALVADVYKKWVLGATSKAAQDAAVLFQNADNPGDPRVQAILKHLPPSQASA
jgi:hypothetical protein